MSEFPSAGSGAAGFASPADAVAWLRTPDAIRARCGLVLATAEREGLEHFELVPSRLDAVAEYVIDTIRSGYPDLAIPYHSRWRHFSTGAATVGRRSHRSCRMYRRTRSRASASISP